MRQQNRSHFYRGGRAEIKAGHWIEEENLTRRPGKHQAETGLTRHQYRGGLEKQHDKGNQDGAAAIEFGCVQTAKEKLEAALCDARDLRDDQSRDSLLGVGVQHHHLLHGVELVCRLKVFCDGRSHENCFVIFRSVFHEHHRGQGLLISLQRWCRNLNGDNGGPPMAPSFLCDHKRSRTDVAPEFNACLRADGHEKTFLLLCAFVYRCKNQFSALSCVGSALLSLWLQSEPQQSLSGHQNLVLILQDCGPVASFECSKSWPRRLCLVSLQPTFPFPLDAQTTWRESTTWTRKSMHLFSPRR
eukprot:m.101526 g.101526  ORF g.101526 m.101526 type:complete len:301 (+) comp14090_c6_seq3:915-1817(+)